MYQDILKKLMAQNGKTQAVMAEELGMNSQAALSQRLRDSANPRMRETREMLGLLGYEIAFVPKGMVERNPALAEVAFVPEFPERPSKGGGAL